MSAKLRLFSLVAGAVALAIIAVLVWRHQAAERTAALDAGQRAAMEQVVRDTLMKHPEIILDAVQALEKQRKAADADAQDAVLAAHRKALDDDPNSAVLGNPQGDVTVVEFFDYHCPYCKQMEPALEAMLKQDGRVRLVLKEFPILGDDSVLAARAAIAARNQGKYAPFHDALMQARGAFTPAVIAAIAKQVGLDDKRLTADMTAPGIDKIIGANRALGDALGIDGTPGFVIGDNVVTGGLTMDHLAAYIADARKACHTC
ncbi:MAG TPA: DsbA family protein [Candidatus Sulfotelmatobacter sp.]|nr:DsbA family protein [Candidatus Sulfotelmatobacter sp.]